MPVFFGLGGAGLYISKHYNGEPFTSDSCHVCYSLYCFEDKITLAFVELHPFGRDRTSSSGAKSLQSDAVNLQLVEQSGTVGLLKYFLVPFYIILNKIDVLVRTLDLRLTLRASFATFKNQEINWYTTIRSKTPVESWRSFLSGLFPKKSLHGLTNLLIPTVIDLLSLRLKSLKYLFSSPNCNLLLALDKTRPRFVDVLVQRHSHQVPVFEIRLMLCIMELGLNRWWIDFNHLGSVDSW